MCRHSVLILTLLSVSTTAMAQSATPTADSPTAWQQVCGDRADKLNITGGERNTYMRECVSGERLDSKPAPETSAKPANK